MDIHSGSQVESFKYGDTRVFACEHVCTYDIRKLRRYVEMSMAMCESVGVQYVDVSMHTRL